MTDEYDEILEEQLEEELDEDTGIDYSSYEDDTEIDEPEQRGISIYKYQVEADVPVSERPNLDPYRPFYGRHAALGFTKRQDNLHILDAYDVVTMLDECPTLRHRGTSHKGRILTELQLFRSNDGFERRMEATVIKQSAVDVRDNRFQEPIVQEKKKRFKLFRRK